MALLCPIVSCTYVLVLAVAMHSIGINLSKPMEMLGVILRSLTAVLGALESLARES
jgi:hypothetical protein